uniref:Uncharacterized protein n=1 Tax=Arundo donax TaxID=35708 RepID=A0A0A9E1Q8_ARUDO
MRIRNPITEVREQVVYLWRTCIFAHYRFFKIHLNIFTVNLRIIFYFIPLSTGITS